MASTSPERAPHRPVPLPSLLDTGGLARRSVDAVAQAAGIRLPLDPQRIALAYRSDRLLTIDGSAPPVWSPYSGFWELSDGWVRTHGNYPHHAAALLRGLELPADADRDQVAGALAPLTADGAAQRITAAGGLAVRVAPEEPDTDAALRSTPLLDVQRLSDSPRSTALGDGLHGIRVLDLTRVIAGPVCTRTLALLGADVLRIDPPRLPEPAWQHVDTGHGKRSALLDVDDPRFEELLAAADVLVLGYRPASLDRLGLSPARVIDRHPHLIVAQLSAWGFDQPERAGFDSLVQAASGIAMIESPDGIRPGVLPAQALDHSAGYLLAASVIELLDRRRIEGGGWVTRTSLRRVAAELLGMPRRAQPASEIDVDPAPHLARFDVGGVQVTTVRPALPGVEFAAPHEWGSDQPTW